MSRIISVIGFAGFFVGMGIYLLEPLSFLDFLVPVFTIGGICLVIVAMFLSFREQKKSR